MEQRTVQLLVVEDDELPVDWVAAQSDDGQLVLIVTEEHLSRHVWRPHRQRQSPRK